MLQLTNVSKTFADTTAVDGLNLTVPEGETTVLIGPSGCGKSTVLRMSIGLIRPDEGQVVLDGKPLARENLLEIRRSIGYVIQEGGLFPHMTARQNISLMGRQLDWPNDRITERMERLTDLTGLAGDRLDAYPTQLSGGQRQRVSLMRALMLDPDLLLLDEPLGALDPLIRADLQDELREIFRRLEKTVLLVTHDMHEAVFFGDTIVLMREGKIIQQGTVDALLDTPTDPFVTRFINAQRASLR